MTSSTPDPASGRAFVVLCVVAGVGLGPSRLTPTDRLTWLLEVMPLPLAVRLLAITLARFSLTCLRFPLTR